MLIYHFDKKRYSLVIHIPYLVRTLCKNVEYLVETFRTSPKFFIILFMPKVRCARITNTHTHKYIYLIEYSYGYGKGPAIFGNLKKKNIKETEHRFPELSICNPLLRLYSNLCTTPTAMTTPTSDVTPPVYTPTHPQPTSVTLTAWVRESSHATATGSSVSSGRMEVLIMALYVLYQSFWWLRRGALIL